LPHCSSSTFSFSFAAVSLLPRPPPSHPSVLPQILAPSPKTNTVLRETPFLFFTPGDYPTAGFSVLPFLSMFSHDHHWFPPEVTPASSPARNLPPQSDPSPRRRSPSPQPSPFFRRRAYLSLLSGEWRTRRLKSPEFCLSDSRATSSSVPAARREQVALDVFDFPSPARKSTGQEPFQELPHQRSAPVGERSAWARCPPAKSS